MIGPIPSSISVPLFEAMISLVQNIGSSPTTCWIPYKGIYEHIKKINNVKIVHNNLSLNGTIQFADSTSGNNLSTGLR